MPTHPPGRLRRAVTTTALALIALFTVHLALAPSASAHDTLVASTPAADENLTSAPAEITLTFSAEVLDVGAEILVTGSDDVEHRSVPTIEGSVVSTALPELAVGHYDARWRVVSSDGHPISGVVPFSVGDAGPRPEPESPTTTDAVDGVNPNDVTPSDRPTTTAPPASASPTGPLRPLGVAALGALAALGVLAAAAAVRRRRRHFVTRSQENS